MAEHIPPDRFAAYVAELVEFSGTHRVSCGQPENLAPLLASLRGSESFAADFGSSIRSIIFREHCKVSEAELMKLVVFAWGGERAAESADTADEMPSLNQQIRTILRGVSRGGLSVSSTLPTNPNQLSPSPPTIAVATPPAPQATGSDSQPIQQNPAKHPLRAPASNTTPESPPRQIFTQYAAPASSVPAHAGLPRRRFHPSAAEILATGLTGLVFALLFSIGSLPVYRSRVSVYLPSSTPAAANPLTNERQLTNKAAEQVLAMPHQDTILRQDAASRGMRDLHVGGTEPILYADLVADTARQIRIRQLPSSNLYEITCDSWNPHLATTFCNEFIHALDDKMDGALSAPQSTQSAHIVDAATGPGIQIYPRWILQGFAGLIVGCLIGVAIGFVERSPAGDPV